ncbi:uncharacterized protein LOC110343472 isoform X1 [Mesocricetus auratus]|uniref:Uncharacterized protein LOC110343472 isoform X1 n=1 Tax=Mesocricetus auratus TaxID=10036 RepID=A0ABM2XEB9_MESAU|nr:uncharacterized protein LOC110343472 isoform X1 [Mesocricetus auratus]
MQLLAFTVGLGLLFVAGAMMPPLTPARAEQILGKWHIRSWAGNMPIPSWKWSDPLPPFAFERNSLGDLEFRMNLTVETPHLHPLPAWEELRHCLLQGQNELSVLPDHDAHGCVPDPSVFEHQLLLPSFFSWGAIHTLPELIRNGICRTLEADLDAVRIFKEFVETKIPKTGEIITPPHVEACELVQDS